MSPGRLSLSVGEEVYGIAAPHGSFAEYAAAREDKLARKPGNLSFEQAASVPVSAMTALQQSEGPGEPGGRSALSPTTSLGADSWRYGVPA